MFCLSSSVFGAEYCIILPGRSRNKVTYNICTMNFGAYAVSCYCFISYFTWSRLCSNWTRRLASSTYGGGQKRLPWKQSWPLFSPTFFFSLSFSFFLQLLLFTCFGETPVAENLFPPIFWHN